MTKPKGISIADLRLFPQSGPPEPCPQCSRIFPCELIVDAFIEGGYVRMCPLCYADEHLRIHGQEWKPVGKIAAKMYKQAKEWVNKKT